MRKVPFPVPEGWSVMFRKKKDVFFDLLTRMAQDVERSGILLSRLVRGEEQPDAAPAVLRLSLTMPPSPAMMDIPGDRPGVPGVPAQVGLGGFGWRDSWLTTENSLMSRPAGLPCKPLLGAAGAV